MNKSDIFVSICYHKQAPIISTEILKPVHVGAASANNKLDFALPDNTGINISHKNDKWCELTAIYWMRHNVDAEYYGLMHYRRLLSFSKKVKSNKSFAWATKEDFELFGWDDQTIREQMSSHDILTPPTYRVHPAGLPEHLLTSYDMYARDHFIEDLDLCLDICRKSNPEFFPFVLQTLKDTRTRFGNMFVMRRDFFFQYTDWIFPILEEAERKIDSSNYDSYQSRVIGFLAERLTEAYFRYAETVGGARVKERPVAFAAKPPQPALVAEKLDAAQDRLSIKLNGSVSARKPIHLAYAIDDRYAPHAAASIHSVLLHSDEPDRYKIHVFHKGDLTPESCQRIEKVTNSFGAQTSCVEIPVESLQWLPMNRPHISLTTYYRLLLHKFLPDNVDRVIYIDADTLATSALEELWDTDLEGHAIAAAPDEGGLLQTRRLQLNNSHKYFNAGILLLDIARLRGLDLESLVMEAFESRGQFVMLQDQDLLNIIFEDKTKSLDLKWNVNNRIFLKNELDPAYSDEESQAAAADPGILHFTDARKPWHRNCHNPYYDLYWFHLNQTPWAETQVANYKRRARRALWSRLNNRYKRNIAESLYPSRKG